MASSLAVVRNLSLAGFLGGTALLAYPYLINPEKRTAAITSLVVPKKASAPIPSVQPPAPAAAEPATVVPPPNIQANETPPPPAPTVQAPTPDASENTDASNAQSGNGAANAPTAADLEERERFESVLMASTQVPLKVKAGDDGFVDVPIPYRQGPDLNTEVYGIVPANTAVHIIVLGDNNYALCTFQIDGVEKRGYILATDILPGDSQ